MFYNYELNPPDLRSWGVPDHVAAYVEAQPDSKVRGKMYNQLKKEPTATIDDLSKLIEAPKKRTPTDFERRMSHEGGDVSKENTPFGQWFIYQLMSHRTPKYTDSSTPFEKRYNITLGYDFVNLQSIRDWYNATRPNISSYTWETAMEAQEEWHQACALAGEGEEYDDSDHVVAEFKDGWSIHQVRSKNNLEVEGNRMGHCVGSYTNQGADGWIFSLRDPKNEPHVTVEMEPGKNVVHQIQGKSNKPPIDKYKAYIKEWFQTLKPQPYNYYGDADIDPYDSDSIDAFLGNDYGMAPAFESFDLDDHVARVKRRINDHRNNEPHHDDNVALDNIAYLAFLSDKAKFGDNINFSEADVEGSNLRKIYEVIDELQEEYDGFGNYEHQPSEPTEDEFDGDPDDYDLGENDADYLKDKAEWFKEAMKQYDKDMESWQEEQDYNFNHSAYGIGGTILDEYRKLSKKFGWKGIE